MPRNPALRSRALCAAVLALLLGCDSYGSRTTGVSRSTAALASLSLSAAALTPAFSANTTAYTATVANGTTSTTVTASVATSGATLTIAGASVASGIESGPIALAVGANTIPIVVTNPDGATRTYSVTVTRSS